MKYTIHLLFVFLCHIAFAQEDALKIIAEQTPVEKSFTIATFKTTRIINMHTVETLGKRTLDFRISHRFGPVNSGAEDFRGLDGGASIRLGLEYSYEGRLMAGIGRTSYQKMLDGFLKYRWLRQTDDNRMPLSVTLLAGAYYTTQKDPNKEILGFDKYEHAANRASYVVEIIAARKFSRNFSFQVAPYFVHYNLVERISDLNDMYGVQAAFRYKFTRSMAVTAEYAYNINDYSSSDYYDSFGAGFEIETGGHVFQVHLTNSFGLTENQFLPYTNTKWDNMGIRLGFNISRVFTI